MERISPLQMAYLMVTMRATMMLALLPVVPSTPGARDAWLSTLLGTALTVVPVWLVCRLIAKMPGKDLVEISETCLGKLPGKLAGVLFLGFFAMNAAIVLRQFSDFLTSAPMPETPTEFFLGAMALTTAYAIRKGLEPLARTNELLLPPLFLFVFVILLMGIPQMDPIWLKPYLSDGWGPVLTGGSTVAGLWSEAIIIGMLAPLVSKPELIWRYSFVVLLFNGLWVSVSALAVVMFFSAHEAQQQVFPIYTLMRTVTLFDFLERMDPFFLIAWTITSINKLALLSYVSCQALGRVLGLADFRVLALPMGAAGAVVALTQFGSIADLIAFNHPSVIPILSLPFSVILPMLLLAASRRIRSGRGRS